MDITSKHFIAQNDYKSQKKMNAFFFFLSNQQALVFMEENIHNVKQCRKKNFLVSCPLSYSFPAHLSYEEFTNQF